MPTAPEPCAHCEFCEFADICDAEWRGERLAHLRRRHPRPRAAALGATAVATLAALAALDRTGRRHRPGAAGAARRPGRAAGRGPRADPTQPPPFVLDRAEPTTRRWGHGFEPLPEPDDGDVFLDFEGHPFWRADRGLFFLFGLLDRDDDGRLGYDARWAHDRRRGGRADRCADRRTSPTPATAIPGMHVYHYNHTERSALERLAAEHGVGEHAWPAWSTTGLFVDLLAVARNALAGRRRVVRPEEPRAAHRLRARPRHRPGRRRGRRVRGVHAATATRRASTASPPTTRTTSAPPWRCATGWSSTRPGDSPWRRRLRSSPTSDDARARRAGRGAARLRARTRPSTCSATCSATGARVAGAHWRRMLAKLVARTRPPARRPRRARRACSPSGRSQRTGARGQAADAGDALRASRQQPLSTTFEQDDGEHRLRRRRRADRLRRDRRVRPRAGGTVDLTCGTEARGARRRPDDRRRSNDWVTRSRSPRRSSSLAADGARPRRRRRRTRSASRCSAGDLPAFTAGSGPAGGRFADDLDDIIAWVTHLDHSYVAIQGPPGTGKTYRARTSCTSSFAAASGSASPR